MTPPPDLAWLRNLSSGGNAVTNWMEGRMRRFSAYPGAPGQRSGPAGCGVFLTKASKYERRDKGPMSSLRDTGNLSSTVGSRPGHPYSI